MSKIEYAVFTALAAIDDTLFVNPLNAEAASESDDVPAPAVYAVDTFAVVFVVSVIWASPRAPSNPDGNCS